MRSQSFHLGASPRLFFRACRGDLRIQGWELDEVQLLAHQEADLQGVREVEGGLEITGRMPRLVNVPQMAGVVVENCLGDVHVAACSSLRAEKHRGDLSLHRVNNVELEVVHGDVHVRGCQSLHVTTLHGDLRVRGASGELSIAGLHGDASLHELGGPALLRDITGDVTVRGIREALEARNVTGDLVLTANLLTGAHHLEAMGDVALYLEPSSDVQVDLEAPLGRIVCELELNQVEKTAHRLSGILGQGKASLHAVAQGGDIRLRQLSADEAAQARERERTREEARAFREAERARRIADHMRRIDERLTRKAEERANRIRHWQLRWSDSRRMAEPQNLAEERLAVLKMVSEGKITAAQAEALLKALED